MSETIPIASDHAGVEMKNRLESELKKLGYEPEDLGSKDPEQPDDYPDYAHPVAKEVSDGSAKRGILLCGSGVGMDIVANRYPGVRAALAWEPEIGELSRRHNDSNVLRDTDRKSTRLNSSHVAISYAVFCLKKK